jgi:hypothetical protein
MLIKMPPRGELLHTTDTAFADILAGATGKPGPFAANSSGLVATPLLSGHRRHAKRGVDQIDARFARGAGLTTDAINLGGTFLLEEENRATFRPQR